MKFIFYWTLLTKLNQFAAAVHDSPPSLLIRQGHNLGVSGLRITYSTWVQVRVAENRLQSAPRSDQLEDAGAWICEFRRHAIYLFFIAWMNYHRGASCAGWEKPNRVLQQANKQCATEVKDRFPSGGVYYTAKWWRVCKGAFLRNVCT